MLRLVPFELSPGILFIHILSHMIEWEEIILTNTILKHDKINCFLFLRPRMIWYVSYVIDIVVSDKQQRRKEEVTHHSSNDIFHTPVC